jgi:hypothetical protein
MYLILQVPNCKSLQVTASTVCVQRARGAASGRGGRWRCGCAAGKQGSRAAGQQGSRLARAGLPSSKQLKQTSYSSAVLQTGVVQQRRRLQKSVRRRLLRGCRGPARVDQKELLCCCFRMGDLAAAIGLPGAAGRAGGARPTQRPPSAHSAPTQRVSESARSRRLASSVQRSRKVSGQPARVNFGWRCACTTMTETCMPVCIYTDTYAQKQRLSWVVVQLPWGYKARSAVNHVECHGEHPVAWAHTKPSRLERWDCGCTALHISFGFGTLSRLPYSVTASARLHPGERQHVSCGSCARLKRPDTWVLGSPATLLKRGQHGYPNSRPH